MHTMRLAAFKPQQKQSYLFDNRDVRTATGVIHGGSGKPMEIDKTSIKCYNCNGQGHLAKDCRKPKKTTSKDDATCYNCDQKGHYATECKAPIKKKDRKTGSHGKGKTSRNGKFKKRKRIKKCEEGDDQEEDLVPEDPFAEYSEAESGEDESDEGQSDEEDGDAQDFQN
jgi:hypothetical protein